MKNDSNNLEKKIKIMNIIISIQGVGGDMEVVIPVNKQKSEVKKMDHVQQKAIMCERVVVGGHLDQTVLYSVKKRAPKR